MEQITSLQNPKIKNLQKLAKNKERRLQNVALFEGARELMLAQRAGYDICSVYICPELFAKTRYPDVLHNIPESKMTEVSAAVFEKIAYREGSDGLLTLSKPKSHTLSELQLTENPFVIILEAIEKPGNLGAILRTADAAKADAVIVCDPLADVYNPNVVRSSVGCLFTVQTAICTSADALKWLQDNNITVYAAELQASQWYHETDFTKPAAIVMGTEADGLTRFWLDNAHKRIKIPMRGEIDSLNVSVSTAILTFEAMRQRGF
ncbi:TrmH family RNA methyltransferase [Dysgonomonas sp. PH5-45]|uniref:TrmH family RNA methyltransferase n=1 Tax=unclassified Dysgonomonas TaxID=2630389 RepID=UPI002473AE72|nr:MULTISPECIES: RNA methyltransferase [unclassified Dysgonomonas]MDH6355329.1 TrmH family RNA methyltransferase [Dysgonomonas sp. PH5-45]MDH6388227.1 TrmH family RNA methyltransferase [Dysgonomonas sp. PH5-37]